MIINRKSLTNVELSPKMTPDQESALQDAFPEFNLTFHHTSAHTHPYAYNSRLLELRLMLFEHGYDPLRNIPNGYNDQICDIGGNYAQHVKSANYGIHSCSPILDNYDSSRDTRRMLNISVMRMDALVERHLALIHAVLDPSNTTVRCKNVVQECPRTAMRAIMLHSSYDMNLKDIANAMTRKNTLLLTDTYIYTPEILTQRTETGHIPVLDAHYVIDRPNNCLRFSFVGDPSFNYNHRLDTNLALGLNSLVTCSRAQKSSSTWPYLLVSVVT